MAGNIVELAVNQDIDGQNGYTASFPATAMDQLMLEFDPKHTGPPVCALTGHEGAKMEIHPMPLRGREGRFSAHVGNDTKWSGITVTMAAASKHKGKLLKIRLVVKSHVPGAPPA